MPTNFATLQIPAILMLALCVLIDLPLALPAIEPANPPNVRAIAFSPDGRLLAACYGEPKDKGIVAVWDVATRQRRWTHIELVGIPALAFSPDGKRLAIGTFSPDAKIL